MQKLTPFLWFDTQAEEAARYYISIFKNSRIVSILRHTAAGPGPEGSVLTVKFELFGQEFVALNGGPQFHFSEAVSIMVNCDSQQEVDEYWDKLTADGIPVECGWLKDKYGFCWQIAPRELLAMLEDPDTEKASRVMHAMRHMVKLDLPTLKQAYVGAGVASR